MPIRFVPPSVLLHVGVSQASPPVVSRAPRRLTKPAHVGRERELSTVVAALSGPPAVVLVEGEAGIGKTRLVHELLAASPLRDRGVMVTSCPPLPEPLLLGPIVAALRGLELDVRDLELSPLAGALRPLFPEWARDLPPALEPLADPSATRQRLLAATAELLDKLGTDVLVVEDAQWADPATMELLLLLSAEPTPKLSLVATYRPEEVRPNSLLGHLTSRSAARMSLTRVELEPLTHREAGELVGSMLGAEQISDEFVAMLHERTTGLPLALEQSVLLLTDRRDVFRRRGEWARRTIDRLQVPATVRDMVLERKDRLDPVARRVLEASAVLAEPATASVLAATASLDEGRTREGLATALASRLLREVRPGRFGFRHVLALLAVYEAIPISERRRVHGRAARGLEPTMPPPVLQLAQHFREAQEIEPWALYAEIAADRAMESADDRVAVALLDELLAVAEHPADRHGRLAQKLAQAATLGASIHGELGERALETIRAALARHDLRPADRGRLRLSFARLLVTRCDHKAAFAEFERAVPDLADSPVLAARAMIALSCPSLGGRPVDEHRGWLSRVGSILPRLPATTERTALTVDYVTEQLMLGDAAGWQAVAELPTEVDASAARRELARGYANLGQVSIAWGRYGRARSSLDVARDLVDATSYPLVHSVVRVLEAYLDYCTGAWSGLAETADRLVSADDIAPINRLEMRMIQGLLALAAGDTRAAEPALQEVADGYRGAGLEDDPLTATAALARLQLARGDTEAALETTEPRIGVIVETGNWLWATDVVPVRVEALVQAGDIDRADALVRRLAAWLADRDAPAPAAALATCRAIVAEYCDQPHRAAVLFGRAARAWAALPRPYGELLSAERRGGALLAAGEETEGLKVLADCQRRLYELGARWDADRVARVLRTHGVEVRRTWRGGRHGYGNELSPRELEVLHLVAAGLTNRKVAEALFISPRTVAEHVSGAMRKLGVTSRTALAAAATKAGMLVDESDHPVKPTVTSGP
jgi:DNA-binding CsgD family transcriptional regulator/tetratricopeptide (TPR) repeat protein